MILCDTKLCTGCMSCLNSCQYNAIKTYKDALGRKLPRIDKSKCVGCGLCRKVCHIINRPQLNFPIGVYAARSNNEADKYSSSGGLATVIARHILDLGGIVFGVGFEKSQVKYLRIDKIEDLEKIRGSKYVESEVGDIYKTVKVDLCNKRIVLFIGTPCCVAGLRGYLNKEYENLVTVDLICHGTPPQDYLIEHVNKMANQWDEISFRGRYEFLFTVYQDKKVIKQKGYLEDEYFCAFFKNLIFRENCYRCIYARPDRCSDITLGDFWGIDKETLSENYDGRISLVLLNTIKGEQLFVNLNDIKFEKRSFEEAMNPQQTNLRHPSQKPKGRELFETYYPQKGLEKAIYMTELSKILKKQRIRGWIKKTLIGRLAVKIKNRKET